MAILSRRKISIIAQRVINAYMRLSTLKDDEVYRIEPELLCSDLLGLKVDFQMLSRSGEILGMTSFEKVFVRLPDIGGNGGYYLLDGKTVLLESYLNGPNANLGRKNFTLMHEASHQILKMMYPNDYGISDLEHRLHFCRAYTVADWNEWQANTLAAEILLPDFLVEKAMTHTGIKGKIKRLNKVMFPGQYEKFSAMTEILGCSRTALAIRMMQMGYMGESDLDNPYKLFEAEVDEHV